MNRRELFKRAAALGLGLGLVGGPVVAGPALATGEEAVKRYFDLDQTHLRPGTGAAPAWPGGMGLRYRALVEPSTLVYSADGVRVTTRGRVCMPPDRAESTRVEVSFSVGAGGDAASRRALDRLRGHMLGPFDPVEFRLRETGGGRAWFVSVDGDGPFPVEWWRVERQPEWFWPPFGLQDGLVTVDEADRLLGLP